MSHWHKGKLSLKCSLAVLRKALVNIVPAWEKHIQIDPDGKLVIKSGYNQPDQNGISLKIPMGSTTGISGADLGFSLGEDGKWSIHHDYLPRQLSNPEGQLLQEIAAMRARAIAKVQGYEIDRDTMEGRERVIEVLIPVGN